MTVETPVRPEDPAQELDALIEEARRRARRRRLGYVAAVVAALLGTGAALLLIGGDAGSSGDGGSEPAEDPRGVVQDAGAETFSEDTLEVILRAETFDGIAWSASGLVEPGDGRFRLTLEETPPGGLGVSKVIGLDGEGFEGTVAAMPDNFLGGRRDFGRCWFNPHSPVGSFDRSISVEESMRVTGSVLESLKAETATARSADGEGFEVRLKSSASKPRNDFDDKPRRVWGDRKLLDRVSRPIEVRTTDGGQVAGLTIPLTDYKPYKFFNDRMVQGNAPPDPAVPQVALEATFSPTDRGLELNPPNCQAME